MKYGKGTMVCLKPSVGSYAAYVNTFPWRVLGATFPDGNRLRVVYRVQTADRNVFDGVAERDLQKYSDRGRS